MKKHIIIPVFIPHEGCPYTCVFCNQKTISGCHNIICADSIRAIVDTHLKTIKNDSENFIEIAFYGGSFTGLDPDLQEIYLEIAGIYRSQGRIDSIRLSTRPDYINENILTFLACKGVGIVEIGAQSMDDEVLKASRRGHDASSVRNAAKLIKASGITLGIQTMIGLPEDTIEKDVYTAMEVAGLAPSFVRIYPTLVVEGTLLERDYRSGNYVPLELDEAVAITAKLLDIYNKAGIRVIRAGLQPTEEFNGMQGILAGPFHPSFRQLAESRLALDRICEIIESPSAGYFTPTGHTEQIVLRVSPRDISTVIGHKRSNIFKIKEKYNIQNVIIVSDKNITGIKGIKISGIAG